MLERSRARVSYCQCEKSGLRAVQVRLPADAVDFSRRELVLPEEDVLVLNPTDGPAFVALLVGGSVALPARAGGFVSSQP